MATPVIQARSLSKRYRLGTLGAGTLRDEIQNWWARRRGTAAADDSRDDYWALRDVCFDIEEGDVVGIIGKNGAGKSTLLKILSRITEPTSGEARIRGRVASLLEVGTGFHPELTGRENIFLNGTILGMTRAEVRAKFEEIVEFSGIRQFIDTPVKRYSSGMYVRLAFAVAANLDSEILIVDEVLAVGDADFQAKCLGKIRDVAGGGRTVIVVSHNMATTADICAKAIYLEAGRIASFGDARTVIDRYLGSGASAASPHWTRGAEEPAGDGVTITSVSLALQGKQPCHTLRCDVEIKATDTRRPLMIAVDILDGLNNTIMQALPRAEPFLDASVGRLAVTIRLPPLIPGRYFASVWVGHHFTDTCDFVEKVASFEIMTSPTIGRVFPHSYHHGHVVPESKCSAVPPTDPIRGH